MALTLATCFASTSFTAQAASKSESLEYQQAHQRGTQALIWSLPAVSMKFFHEGMKAAGADDYGDIAVYFGPKAPAGMENNWIQTGPGEGWNMLFRLYGPLDPWFKKTWRPSEIELVK